MADKDFADKVSKLLKEHGYRTYGTQPMPVENAVWPEGQPESQPPVEEVPPTDEVPPGSQQSVVTNGETTPIDQPRSDVAAQQNGGELDADTMSEVGSLLITIGFILTQKGYVADKFNTPEVLGFLQQNFKEVPGVDVPPAEGCGAPEAMPAQPMVPQVQSYMEQRKLLESKTKK